MKLRLAGVAAACLIAGCGGNHHTTTTTPRQTAPPPATAVTNTNTGTGTPTTPAGCVSGRSYMGCAQGAPPTFSLIPPTKRTLAAPPTGAKFPDVSNWQGCNLNWAKIGAVGAAIKLGEAVTTDTCAGHNISSLHAAKKTVVPYWFIRPIGTAAEAKAIVAALKARGLTASRVVIYTSPGTWPGGSSGGLAVWEAAYGSVRPALPFSATVLAWQYTDSGYVSGLGYGDVSVNYGLLKAGTVVLDEEVPGIAGYAPALAKDILAAFPKPKPAPSPFAIYPAAKILIHGQKISERNTVTTWWARGCKNPVRRSVCKSTRLHLTWLAGRLQTIADRTRPPNWKPNHRGARHYRIERILTSR